MQLECEEVEDMESGGTRVEEQKLIEDWSINYPYFSFYLRDSYNEDHTWR